MLTSLAAHGKPLPLRLEALGPAGGWEQLPRLLAAVDRLVRGVRGAGTGARCAAVAFTTAVPSKKPDNRGPAAKQGSKGVPCQAGRV